MQQAKPTQPTQEKSKLEVLAKRFLALLYIALWLFAINLYFTFTPIEHSFIHRYKDVKKHPNRVVETFDKWEFKFSGIQISKGEQ